MNIQTVAANLRNTIAGKEILLSKTYEDLEDSKGSDLTSHAIAEFLEINIAVLKRILQDVEQCIPKSDYSLDGPMIKMFRED